MISPGKLEVTQRGKDAVERAIHPTTVSELRSFLWLCNVYQRFVKGFTRIAAPLKKKLMKGELVQWTLLTAEEMKAFETLKAVLISPQVLALPRAGFKYTLDTDDCDVKVVCVLLQDQPGPKTPKPVGFWSRTLTPAENGYETTNKECLAVVWAVLTLRPYLEGE